MDLSPLCLCLIPSKLIWLCVQSCQNKYGLIAESASANHGALRLLSSPAVCSQGRGLDHKLQICTEDVQIFFFLLQFETVFLYSFVSMVSGDLGFAWRFSPLDMPDQPMLEILQTHFEEEAFVCPQRKPDKGGEQIKEQFPALPLQNCTGFNSVCVRPPTIFSAVSIFSTPQPPLTLPALLSVARAPRASWIRAPGFALVLVSLVRRELEQSWRATSSFSLLPPSLLVSILHIDHLMPDSRRCLIWRRFLFLFFASYIAVEPSCVNNHSIWKSNSVFSLILIKITSICS